MPASGGFGEQHWLHSPASGDPDGKSGRSSVIRSDPNRTIIPGWWSTPRHVPTVPILLHQGYYDDNEFYLTGIRLANQQGAQDYLDEWVFDLPDRAAYWDKLGLDVHHRLNPGDRFSQPRTTAHINYEEEIMDQSDITHRN